MTVEAALDTSTPAIDPGVISDASAIPGDDAAMDAVWDRLVTNNGADRENGRFVSPDPDKRAAAAAPTTETPQSVSGEGGEQEASTVSDVPLPANWYGLDEVWGKVPADARQAIADHQREQHAKLSDMGRKVAAFEPLSGVGQEVAGYLAEAAKRQGAAYDGPQSPAEGIAYLFNIQKAMDADAPSTILSIMDTYGVRDKVAALLGVKSEPSAGPDASALQTTIGRLEATIRELTDPSRVEKIVDKKAALAKHEEEVSRLQASKPLYAKIPEARMVFFIQEGWKNLGQDATTESVFDYAYKAAVEADPALRAQSQAAQSAAKDAADKAEAAKRGASVNLKSTAPTRAPKVSEDDAMEEVWRRLNPQG